MLFMSYIVFSFGKSHRIRLSNSSQRRTIGAVHLRYTPATDPVRLFREACVANQRTKPVAELLGVMNVPKSGRQRLVAVAVELFYRYGFGAIGVDQVLTTAGVTKTTFYKHFESKDELMVAAVQLRDEWESQAWGRAVRKLAGDDPVRQLLAMLDVMDLWFNDPDFGGCMFINA